MKKNGFIATSIIYSFFLVFCAILLLYIAQLAHNTLLINKQKDIINQDIHTSLKLSNNKVNLYSHFRLNICKDTNSIDSSERINYYLISRDIDNSKYTFLSSNVNFKLNSIELLDSLLNHFKLNNIYVARSINTFDFDIIKTNDTMLNMSNYDFNDNSSFIIYDDDNTILVYKINSANSDTITYSNTLSGDIFVRMAFDITDDLRILSGDGSFGNPYVLESSRC